MTSSIKIKQATVEDTGLILTLIKELAAEEGLSHEITATEELLRQSLFEKSKNAEVIIAYWDEKPVGIAVYFYNFSTFTGKYGIYLDDIYVKLEVRRKKIGKTLMNYLIQKAKENNCHRLEWCVLNRNENAIRFYDSLGAQHRDGWAIYRLPIS
jgi:GNAT superfamily N-acetyltransferase